MSTWFRSETGDRMPHPFYNRHPVEVAHELVGKTWVWAGQQGIITETEAYRGCDDPASHAYRGPTPRNAVMFGEAGHTYVYFIYGMYHCINVVTEPVGHGSGVLIRGLYIPPLHLNGPGKLCRHLGITRVDNGINLVADPAHYIAPGISDPPLEITTRIGIKRAQEKPWRFVIPPAVCRQLFQG